MQFRHLRVECLPDFIHTPRRGVGHLGQLQREGVHLGTLRARRLGALLRQGLLEQGQALCMLLAGVAVALGNLLAQGPLELLQAGVERLHDGPMQSRSIAVRTG